MAMGLWTRCNKPGLLSQCELQDSDSMRETSQRPLATGLSVTHVPLRHRVLDLPPRSSILHHSSSSPRRTRIASAWHRSALAARQSRTELERRSTKIPHSRTPEFGCQWSRDDLSTLTEVSSISLSTGMQSCFEARVTVFVPIVLRRKY